MLADRGGSDGAPAAVPRPRGTLPLLLVGAVVYALAAGYLVWRWTWAEPGLPQTHWLEPTDLEDGFGPRVAWEDTFRGERSWATFRTDADGRIVVETLYVTGTLPASGPPLPLRVMDDADRHARDLAFARGEEAFERFRQEQGWDDPAPEPPDRGEVHLDVGVDCLRVVVSSSGTATPTGEELDDLGALVAGRVRAWLDQPQNAELCEQLWGYP
jgi:hypothetical protein